jgi:hypothetical protein
MVETKIMSADVCARIIVEAALKRRRLVITSLRGRAMRWLKLIAPALVDRSRTRDTPS